MSTTTTTQTSSASNPVTTITPASQIDIPRGPVQTQLEFFSVPADAGPDWKPWNYVEPQPEGQPQRNYSLQQTPVTINDLRGKESSIDMNVMGFGVHQGVQSKLSEDKFDDDEAVKETYYPEVESLLKEKVPGAQRVFLFDHTVRRSHANARRAPVNRAHIDQTTKSAIERVHLHMGDEAPALLKNRYRLINVWRPLNGPVVASPLAYADSRSVPDEDIVPVEHRYPTRTGETAGVKYTEKGKWYYWSGMKNDERILLQCFDSQDGARTPHSAFFDPRTKEDWPGRDSIEVRALVFG